MKRLTPLGLLLLLLSGCAPQERTLTVFAAASLTDAFREIGAAFEEAHPGVTVAMSFASSSELATQINEGAPVDVFASANQRQMQVVADDHGIERAAQFFLTNRLVVIAPSGNPAGIDSFDDIAQEGVQLVLAAPEVPVRGFTDQMLEAANADPAYGGDFQARALANLVSEEANVRQVAAKIVLGEADAGVVYQSDVTPDIADQVLSFAIPDAINPVAEYPIAQLSGAPQGELAADFITFVLSAEGQSILARWGFGPKP